MAEKAIKNVQDFLKRSAEQSYEVSSYEDVKTYENDSEEVQSFLEGKEDFQVVTVRPTKRGYREREAVCFTIKATGKRGFCDLHKDYWGEEGEYLDPTSIKLIEQRNEEGNVRFKLYGEPKVEII